MYQSINVYLDNYMEEDVLSEDLHPDTCEQLFDLCQRRCRSEARIGDPGGRSLAIKVSNGRLRLTKASETTKKLWEPTLRAIARGWPLAQCVPHQLQRGIEDSAASQQGEELLLGMIQALTDADLTWQKRVWLSGLCYHSGKAVVAKQSPRGARARRPRRLVELAAAG